MSRRFTFLSITFLCISWVALLFPSASKADSLPKPNFAGTAYDLIDAVNALRASYGVHPYTINSILMYTAQAQADFMAANGTVTHSGPGGIGVTERLLAAGYPLAGDLSLGGFRSENITGGLESMPAQQAVDQWTGDAPHLTTMISADLTEIGAGVAVASGRVYYVIDCARPSTAGASQSSTTPVASGSAVPAVGTSVQPVQAVVLSTPNADGDVIHEVKYGQSLWQIAIAYETKIDEIKRLNNLSGNDIYPGQKLLVKTGVSELVFAITETSTPELLPTGTPTVRQCLPSPTAMMQPEDTPTFLPVATVVPVTTSTTTGIAIGIIIGAVLGGGVIAWLGRKKKEDQ
ncbi:MAG: CAP domain-containing protein [Anaerolineales bacterium]